jgi:hypothetical protein
LNTKILYSSSTFSFKNERKLFHLQTIRRSGRSGKSGGGKRKKIMINECEIHATYYKSDKFVIITNDKCLEFLN